MEVEKEDVITGTIQVLPDDGLTLTSAAGTDNQSLCVGTNPLISTLTTITYQISGGALSANFNGLPPGFTTSYNAITKVYSIFGTATSDVVSNPTIYNYTVTTSGTCTSYQLENYHYTNKNRRYICLTNSRSNIM